MVWKAHMYKCTVENSSYSIFCRIFFLRIFFPRRVYNEFFVGFFFFQLFFRQTINQYVLYNRTWFTFYYLPTMGFRTREPKFTYCSHVNTATATNNIHLVPSLETRCEHRGPGIEHKQKFFPTIFLWHSFFCSATLREKICHPLFAQLYSTRVLWRTRPGTDTAIIDVLWGSWQVERKFTEYETWPVHFFRTWGCICDMKFSFNVSRVLGRNSVSQKVYRLRFWWILMLWKVLCFIYY